MADNFTATVTGIIAMVDNFNASVTGSTATGDKSLQL